MAAGSAVHYADRWDLMDLARAEREARDAGQWDAMANLYHPGAHVRVSWFTGSATEFIEASQQRFGRPARSIHQIGMPAVQVSGDRAIVNTPCTLYIDRAVEGVDCELVCLLSHQSRAERRQGSWRLSSLAAIYKKDFLLPRDPGGVIPFDRGQLQEYRASYRYLSASRGAQGKVPDQTLPGVDRPDLLGKLLDADQAWLHSGDRLGVE